MTPIYEEDEGQSESPERLESIESKASLQVDISELTEDTPIKYENKPTKDEDATITEENSPITEEDTPTIEEDTPTIDKDTPSKDEHTAEEEKTLCNKVASNCDEETSDLALQVPTTEVMSPDIRDAELSIASDVNSSLSETESVRDYILYGQGDAYTIVDDYCQRYAEFEIPSCEDIALAWDKASTCVSEYSECSTVVAVQWSE